MSAVPKFCSYKFVGGKNFGLVCGRPIAKKDLTNTFCCTHMRHRSTKVVLVDDMKKSNEGFDEEEPTDNDLPGSDVRLVNANTHEENKTKDEDDKRAAMEERFMRRYMIEQDVRIEEANYRKWRQEHLKKEYVSSFQLSKK